MVDYKEMYLTMMRASEEAVSVLAAARKKSSDLDLPVVLANKEAAEKLIAAQQECEDLYLASAEKN